MLKGRGRDPRSTMPGTPTLTIRSMVPQRAPLAKPEPDYEVVEFPSEQYQNAKLQPPPPPPPRPMGHPADALCGLCGGGGARVRCTECGRRTLCSSCDEMYHRHPKRRNHQRLALTQSQLRDERPPLPPKAGPPVPPPRKHKGGGDRSSASPRLPAPQDPRRATLGGMSMMPGLPGQMSTMPHTNNFGTQRPHQQMPHPQAMRPTTPAHLGSMPYLPATAQHPNMHQNAEQTNTLGHFPSTWSRPRSNLTGFNMVQPAPMEAWEGQDNVHSAWGRPLRRGTSVMELGGMGPVGVGGMVGAGAAGGACGGCAHCAGTWRYGSCAALDHPWAAGWPPCYPPPAQPPPAAARLHPHAYGHPPHTPHTPQPYRRSDSRAVSRAASRAGSRAASPAASVRSRLSRRAKPRSPSPPLPSSDADSESDADSPGRLPSPPSPPAPPAHDDDGLGPAPPPPDCSWQCEHCTFVNEPGVRVCVVCCRTPIAKPKIVAPTALRNGVAKLNISETTSPLPSRKIQEESRRKRASEPKKSQTFKEKTSTGCGPSPPRTESPKIPQNRLATPMREQNDSDRAEFSRVRHDIAVGPSPPKEIQERRRLMNANSSQENISMRVSPFREKMEKQKEIPQKHSISVGPSPPRESPSSMTKQISPGIQKKSAGTSPPRDPYDNRSTKSSRTNVSNTGTSPPPQSISTQTYEVPNSWDRAASVTRSRPRRRFRDDRRERSHSRHSLSSDTRESERSARGGGAGGGGGRWEWREPRDSSPGGEWSGSERRDARLTRRASHLDLRRTRTPRRSSLYGSEAPSPEPLSGNRTVSLEALTGTGARREVVRGLELARLMGEAERLGFSAAEVHAALAQNPAAPLAWLRERWPSLCAGVRAAAAKLAPGANVTELEARAALARHRGAMWPAVTECVEKCRRQADILGVSEERRLRGHVWGSPTGADDDAAPPLGSGRSHRIRADYSSDEFEVPTVNKFQDDDWMYLPLETNTNMLYPNEPRQKLLKEYNTTTNGQPTKEISEKLISLLIQAGMPSIDENLLLQGLLTENSVKKYEKSSNASSLSSLQNKPNSLDFIQSENDFIDAYNALTRLSPLPNTNKHSNDIQTLRETPASNVEELEFRQMNNDNESTSKKNHSQSNHETVSRQEELNDETIPQISHIPKDKKVILMENNQTHINVTKEILIQPDAQSSLRTDNEQELMSDYREQVTQQRDSKNDQEKSNNLSEIVDNTQKLIQQMKNEINSDIKSFQSRSQSEASSNEVDFSSEHESSYSDTHDDTDDMTSDEKEITSSEEENNDKQNRNIIINRTSSEDNEQFEEAMDHLDSQIEDFKQTNIDILDSIARSLQEEHTITIEINNRNDAQMKQQDSNNNLFAAVNSFEEIYEELNKNNDEPQTIQNFPNVLHKPVPTLVKEIVNMIFVKPEVSRKLSITENKPVALNAVMENIELPSEIKQAEESQQNIHDDKQETSSSDESSFEGNSEFTTQMEIKISNDEPLTIGSDILIIPMTMPVQTANNVSEVNIHVEDKINNVTDSAIVNNIQKTESDNVPLDSNNEIISTVIKLTSLSPDKLLKESSPNKLLKESSPDKFLKESSPDKLLKESSPDKLLKETSPDNLLIEETDSNKSKNSVSNKSNIPKLIKAVPNTKVKPEKNSTKVASKVPIRKASIKQYPAPSPPKTQFGNVQSGQVKKLQTRLFNKPIEQAIKSETIDMKASTSTVNKKKQAPAPPLHEDRQPSPFKQSPPRDKKSNYFRETCRTEDEWTESDTEINDVQTRKPSFDREQTPTMSPPPPITLRRVSGQLIDLARIHIPEGSPERQARMLLAEGATENWAQAQLAVELIARGAEPPAALLAALECADLAAALAYLHQDCELCASRLPEHEMVSMLRCTHRCCRECARHYFTVQITERSIADCVCPYCKEPELENLPEDAWLEYFAHLDILLKTLLDIELHELFQRKLRDRTLARDPNFRWCVECSSGFFVHPKQKKLRCPECKSISCATCRKSWSPNHDGLTCEQYAAWLEDNDPERSIVAVQQHLKENGLECPRCKFKYSLSRGGCMHFTCTQCKYEFCYGCGKPFMMGARCGLSEYCAKLGLHAHHPRNCLFYLRDKEPHELQTLLQMNNVDYETEAAEGSTGRCPIQLQRETPTGLVDAACGSEVSPKQAGLCKNHYLEYLSRLVRGRRVDPLPILAVDDLETLVRRAALRPPPRPYGSLDGLFKRGLIEIVKEKIPLD